MKLFVSLGQHLATIIFSAYCQSAGIPACERPVLLLLLSDGSMLAYQAYQPPHHPLAFQRLPLDWLHHQTPLGPRTLPHPYAVQPTQCIQVLCSSSSKLGSRSQLGHGSMTCHKLLHAAIATASVMCLYASQQATA